MTASLTINQQTYNQQDLLNHQEHKQYADLSDNERAALAFCQRWLDGATEFVVHTSGSTGAPKPILLRREQMQASAAATGQALGLEADMRALVCLPVRYIAGQMMLVRGLVLGLAMTLVEPASNPLAGLPAGAVFDFTAMVPLQLQTLLDGPPDYFERLTRMQAILVGGAPVSARLEWRLQALSASVYHTYGMTETATHVALRRLNGPEATPYFNPLPGVEIEVDERSCLRVKGPMTLDRWLQTNDLVELAPRGQPPAAFRWLGRWDNVINTGGVKVQVETVEAAVEQAWLELGLDERRFFVAGVPDERLGEAVTLLIEGAPLASASRDQLFTTLDQRLDRFALPRCIVYLGEFAETSTGKVDRRASLALAGSP
jgi:O-succinylbenzoic acid--CoA ligase